MKNSERILRDFGETEKKTRIQKFIRSTITTKMIPVILEILQINKK